MSAPALALSSGVLPVLERVAAAHGVDQFALRIASLRALVGDDLRAIDSALEAYALAEAAPSGSASTARKASPVRASVRHLLALGGKRLRPLCVSLASRAGQGFGPAARELAVAAELVHNATLLHDDVIDLGDTRRGKPTARVVYGNAASVYAGDFLLVDALRRVQSVGIAGLLERALGVLGEMLDAEALQLANRGSLRGSSEDYFRVIEGKTASLFRWALYAGGRAGGLDEGACAALETYGGALGVAFQLVDDALDLAGDPGALGKGLFADLREGKLTFPLLCAVRHDPGLADEVERAAAAEGDRASAAVIARTEAAVRACGAVEATRALAGTYVERGVAALDVLPASPARDALQQVARASLARAR